MLSGRPLFEGDREAVLDQHLSDAPVGDVHDALARALGKDPRMRPMILGQFLAELASLGGVAPPRPRPTPTGTATGHPAVSGPPAAPPVGGRAKQGDDAPAAATRPRRSKNRVPAAGPCSCRRKTTGRRPPSPRPPPRKSRARVVGPCSCRPQKTRRRRSPSPRPKLHPRVRRQRPSRARVVGPCS
jgi:hypothetical protein